MASSGRTKHDGYGTQIHVGASAVRLFTISGYHRTDLIVYPARVRLALPSRDTRRRIFDNALIENQLARADDETAISVTNLMELRFVALFAAAGVNIRTIRTIMDEAKRTLEHPHPFATRIIFRTDGKKVVAARLA